MDTSEAGASPPETRGVPALHQETKGAPISDLSKARCKVAVIDTGAFIRLQRLENIGHKCYVTPRVASEIRDAKARKHLQSLLVIPEIRVPAECDIKWVRHFARLTGDLGFLSECDIEIIALTYMLHRLHGDTSKLRTTPAPMSYQQRATENSWAPEATKSNVLLASASPNYPAAQEATSFSASVLGDFSVETPPVNVTKPIGRSDQHHPTDEETCSQLEHTDRKNESLCLSSESEDDVEDDGEGEWVTPSNIHLFGVSVGEEAEIDVACMTADYSIQNVLIQMGLYVVTIDGFRIRSVKLWTLLCRACGATSHDTRKRFCPSCGQQAVDRVPVTVSSETGDIQLHDNRIRRNLRGTVFSIPKPKGGRKNKELILAEDQLLMGGRQREHRHQQRLWEKECAEKDPFNIDVAYEQRGWWSRRHLPSGKLALKGAPRLEAGCRGNPNSTLWHKKGGFKR